MRQRRAGRLVGRRVGHFIGRLVGQPWQWPASAVLLVADLAVSAHVTDPGAINVINVISAGAVEPAIGPTLIAFEQVSGHRVALSYATAPQIRQRIEAGAGFDVVIAPPAVLDELERAGKLSVDRAQRVVIGRVGLGMAVRRGAPLPDLGDTDAVRRELLAADSLVFNHASTGLHFETMLKTLGIDAAVLAKTTRYADGASVMAHVLKGSGRELGIGAITEIVLLREQGLQLAGPLPPPMQNFTTCVAAAMPGPAPAPIDNAAAALLAHLRAPATQATLVRAGIASAE